MYQLLYRYFYTKKTEMVHNLLCYSETDGKREMSVYVLYRKKMYFQTIFSLWLVELVALDGHREKYSSVLLYKSYCPL